MLLASGAWKRRRRVEFLRCAWYGGGMLCLVPFSFQSQERTCSSWSTWLSRFWLAWLRAVVDYDSVRQAAADAFSAKAVEVQAWVGKFQATQVAVEKALDL